MVNAAATDQLKRDFCKCVERATFAPDAAEDWDGDPDDMPF